MQFGREMDHGPCDGKGVAVVQKGEKQINTQESPRGEEIPIAIDLGSEKGPIL